MLETDRIRRLPFVRAYERFLDRRPRLRQRIRERAQELLWTCRGNDPAPDVLDSIRAAENALAKIRGAETPDEQLARSLDTLRKLRRIQEETNVSAAITERLDRQADALARVDLLQEMFGEALDHLHRTVEELRARFPHDDRVQEAADELLDD
jgi:hypothetical protein